MRQFAPRHACFVVAFLGVWNVALVPASAKTRASVGEETPRHDKVMEYAVRAGIPGFLDRLVIYADGGVTLEHQGVRVDAFRLDSTVLLELRDAIAASPLFERSDTSTVMPDGRTSSITIHIGQRRHIGWVSGSIPPALRSLATQLDRIIPKSDDQYGVLRDGLH